MIRRRDEMPIEHIHKMKGGIGYLELHKILNIDEFYGKGRLFAKGKLQPGHSVGSHVHDGDMEVCYFLSGKGIVFEGDKQTAVSAGDANIVLSKGEHKIVNVGSEPLEYMALILFSSEEGENDGTNFQRTD
jgi:mannose-6-phosphate isomerase-like protein (cupin superfamily)